MSDKSSCHDLQIVGFNIEGKVRHYRMSEWKRAIMAFLDGMWSQRHGLVSGILIFDDVTLDIHDENGYHLSRPVAKPEIPRPLFSRSEIHAVTCERNSVELGLARLIRNPDIKILVIEFSTLRLML